MMDWKDIDWTTLERLRTAFLSGAAGKQDYWQSERDLANYDLTFAQRIGWKWDYVLAELARRGWTPPPGELLDWGCGSGIAHRAYLDHFGKEGVTSLNLSDRSPLATSFAFRRAREKYPDLSVKIKIDPPAQPAVMLLSHVLTEMTPEQIEALVKLVATSTSFIWVEPGTYEASLTLIAIRERLRQEFNVVAPCTHAAQCGILATGNERHWCHHFAAPPGGVFTDPDWSRFAQLAGIDLRSLPLSFLVLDRRPVPAPPKTVTRVIGRPRVYKAHALLLGCNEAGVREHKLTKRALPEAFRQAKKDELDCLLELEADGEDVGKAMPWQPSVTRPG